MIDLERGRVIDLLKGREAADFEAWLKQHRGDRGRKLDTLEEQNRFLLNWEATVADTRLHGTTRKQVGKHFVQVERSALMRLQAERFPCFKESRRTVHRDGHVEVEISVQTPQPTKTPLVRVADANGPKFSHPPRSNGCGS